MSVKSPKHISRNTDETLVKTAQPPKADIAVSLAFSRTKKSLTIGNEANLSFKE